MLQTEIDRIVAVVRTAVIGIVIALTGILTPTPARAESPFASWTAVVVAGDWHAHGGGPSEAFDNARRDVAAGLAALGFTPGHTRQFSARADRYPNEGVMRSDPGAIGTALRQLSREASGGCLLYFTSHGNREGIRVGGDALSPRQLSRLLNDSCGDRPTVVILSACYSGVFVPALASPTRMVLTAARADRSSFGCGESDKYPYFDACFLTSLGAAHDFPALGHAVQNCVAARERETHSTPPSEPQLSVGDAIAPILQMYAFQHAQAGVCSGNSTSLAAPSPC